MGATGVRARLELLHDAAVARRPSLRCVASARRGAYTVPPAPLPRPRPRRGLVRRLRHDRRRHRRQRPRHPRPLHRRRSWAPTPTPTSSGRRALVGKSLSIVGRVPTMVFVVAARGRFEIRESHTTPRRPHARTLATFAALDAVVAHVIEPRRGLDVPTTWSAPRRAGARGRWDFTCRRRTALLAEIRAGRRPCPALAAALSGRGRPRLQRVRFRSAPRRRGVARPGRTGRGAPRSLAARRPTPGATTPAVTEPSLPDKVITLHYTLARAGVAHAFGGALGAAYYAEARAPQSTST